MEKKSLWAEVKDVPDFKTPVVILKEQAELLDETTKSILRGEVKSFRARIQKTDPNRMIPNKIIPDNNGNMLGFSLFIVAPQMNYYNYCVLTVAYNPVSVYPVFLESSVLEESIQVVGNESEFFSVLTEILSSNKIKTVIMSLIAQSQEMAS